MDQQGLGPALSLGLSIWAEGPCALIGLFAGSKSLLVIRTQDLGAPSKTSSYPLRKNVILEEGTAEALSCKCQFSNAWSLVLHRSRTPKGSDTHKGGGCGFTVLTF